MTKRLQQILAQALVLLFLVQGSLGFAATAPSPQLQEPTLPDLFSQPAGANSGTSAPLSASVYKAEYIIGAGDALYMEDENMGILMPGGKVLSDGSINIPLVGKVFLAGLSVNQAKQRMNEVYSKYFVNPKITVQVVNQRPVRVYVMGAVAQPGVYVSGKNLGESNLSQTTMGSLDTLLWFFGMHLADALIHAGGLNYNANVRDIKIHRKFPQPVTIHVDMIELLSKGNIIQDIPLRDQDVVEVDELPDNAIVMNSDWEQFSLNNINQEAFQISVLGAVQNPGSFGVKLHDTVLNAIAQAGGLTDLADRDKVFILRTTTTGQLVKRELNLKDKTMIGKKPFQEWAALMPNDVIFVDEADGKKWANYGGGVLNRASSAALFPYFNKLFSKWDSNSGSTKK